MQASRVEVEHHIEVRCDRCARTRPERTPPLMAIMEGPWAAARWVLLRPTRPRDQEPAHVRVAAQQAREDLARGEMPPDVPFHATQEASHRTERRRFVLETAEGKLGQRPHTGRVFCPRCKRRLPFGWRRLVELADSAVRAGARSFLA